nr:class I SAM-dependent methyltransferase [Burkholderiales bacterium]
MRDLSKTRTDFEHKHKTDAEPWDYSTQAAEGLRHDWVVAQVGRYVKSGKLVLDAGCSLGQLTAHLVGVGLNVCAIDLSATAVRKTQDRLARISLRQGQFAPVVKLGDARALRFPEASFAVVLCCDGFEGWELSAEDSMVALNQVSRVLVPGGIATLTDYLHPRRFAQYVESIRTGPLAVSEVHYFHDRLWFQTNTNF